MTYDDKDFENGYCKRGHEIIDIFAADCYLCNREDSVRRKWDNRFAHDNEDGSAGENRVIAMTIQTVRAIQTELRLGADPHKLARYLNVSIESVNKIKAGLDAKENGNQSTEENR